jgi:hypothetical protein
VAVVVVVELVFVVGVELVFAPDPPLLEGDDRVVLGTITVTVTVGVFFVILVPDLVVVVVSPDPVGGFFPLPAPGWNDANSTVPPELGVKLAPLEDPEPDPPDPEPDPADPEPALPDPPDPQLAVV